MINHMRMAYEIEVFAESGFVRIIQSTAGTETTRELLFPSVEVAMHDLAGLAKRLAALAEAKPAPAPIAEMELFAWVGLDERGSGEYGLKIGQVPAGLIPMVATKFEKMSRSDIRTQLEEQARTFGKRIRLCRFTFAQIVMETKNGGDE